MPEPVKTTLLKAIQTAIETIPVEGTPNLLFGQVIRNPSKPIDRDTAVFPLVFIFDDIETINQRNRIAMNEFPLQIEIWATDHELTIGDQCDIYKAEIEKTLLSDALIKTWSMRIDLKTAVKFFEDEFLGGIVLRYTITYSYVWGDPYSQARS